MNLYSTIAIFLFLAALVQWFGISTKIMDALWQWYKFWGYSNDGYTDLGIKMLITTYVLSFLFIIMSVYVIKMSKNKFQHLVAKASLYMYCIGVFFLTVLVASPISKLVSR